MPAAPAPRGAAWQQGSRRRRCRGQQHLHAAASRRLRGPERSAAFRIGLGHQARGCDGGHLCDSGKCRSAAARVEEVVGSLAVGPHPATTVTCGCNRPATQGQIPSRAPPNGSPTSTFRLSPAVPPIRMSPQQSTAYALWLSSADAARSARSPLARPPLSIRRPGGRLIVPAASFTWISLQRCMGLARAGPRRAGQSRSPALLGRRRDQSIPGSRLVRSHPEAWRRRGLR